MTQESSIEACSCSVVHTDAVAAAKTVLPDDGGLSSLGEFFKVLTDRRG
jgi:hypothetical protein